MKKVLVSIFIVLLSINSGYCDNVKFIDDTTNSTTNVMNSIISMSALINVFAYEGNFCADLTTKLKNDISKLIAESATQGQDITLSVIYSACISAYSNENLPTNICYKCINTIINSHNAHLRNSIQSGKLLLKSEQEFKNALAFNECPHPYVGEIYARSSKACYNKCKERAIKLACNQTRFSIFNRKSRACLCEKDADLYDHDNDFYIYIGDIVPTWEDYKKLYNIK